MNKDDLKAIKKCEKKWSKLKEKLGQDYVEIGSCNKDISRYLVPKGTEKEISYYGKPEISYRISDHWNWYSNLKKCNDENYIQCYTEDLPGPYERLSYGKASEPVYAICICEFRDGMYRVIYGDAYDFNENEWIWINEIS